MLFLCSVHAPLLVCWNCSSSTADVLSTLDRKNAAGAAQYGHISYKFVRVGGGEGGGGVLVKLKTKNSFDEIHLASECSCVVSHSTQEYNTRNADY